MFSLLVEWLKLKELQLIMDKETPSHFISQLIILQVLVCMSYHLIMLLPACTRFITKQSCLKLVLCLYNLQMDKP